jgi:transposase
VIRYLTVKDIGEWLGVQGNTVSKYRREGWFTEPAAMTGKVPGWLPEQKAEIMACWIARGLATSRQKGSN